MKERTNSPLAFSGVEAVLFDLDGTLIDSAPDLGLAANKMRTDRGLDPLPQSHYRPFVGSGARGMIFVAFELEPGQAEFDELTKEFFCNYEVGLRQLTELFPGVQQMVDAVVLSGLKWGVVTNKAARFTAPLTQMMPVFKSAGVVVSGDSTPHSKPHPAPLLFAARQLGIAADKCVYVGDDERDIVAGKAAGMQTVAAAYGYLGQDADHRKWAADATINTPLELLSLLKLRKMV